MNRVTELENLIIKHKSLYYSGRPEISDTDYDKLEGELKKLDPSNPVLNIVGAKVENTDKVQHQTKMLSLDKTYSETDLEKWVFEHPSIGMQKIDGVSCSLIYEEGRLVQAKTRGDGSYGEDITNKVLWLPCVPKKIAITDSIEVRGEIFCTEESFFELAEEMEQLKLDKPTSLRNIVAGLLGRKDHIYLSKHLSFLAFELLGIPGIQKESDKFKHLIKNEFNTPDVTHIKNKKDLKAIIEDAQNFMSEGDYQIDGIVFVYDDIELQNGLGETSHHPRYKMAYKFQGETKNTIIEEIIWSVSRNGVLTPVASIVPTELSGAMISRVTLHNYGMVKVHELKKGDEIEIVRSGEVIPKFLRVIKPSKTKFEVPAKCPDCKTNVVEEDIRLFCPNDKCPTKVKEGILHYIQKIGIDDLSSKRLEEMIRVGLVSEISDLYKLKVNDFLSLDKVKEKLATKFFENIEKSKSVDLPTFLSALGISGGGYNKCEKIVQNGFDTLEKILNLNQEKLMEVDSFAEKSSEEFIKSLATKKPLIKNLSKLGFDFKELNISENPIKGKKICITGSLSMKRSEKEKQLRELGAVIVSSVTKNTDFLLTNDKESGSSKNKKANQLSIPIVSEEDLDRLLSK